MKKINILLSAALMFFGLTAKAQTTITFDSEDYAAIGVYDKWEESPFRAQGEAAPELEGHAGVASNPDKNPDEILGVSFNETDKVVAFQRSRYGSNTYGVRIDLKEPIRVTKDLQYIHVMTYLANKPTASRMMVIGLGRRIESSWQDQPNDVEQFYTLTSENVEPKAGWQDVVMSFKGFSYSKEENANSGIDLHSLVIIPDVRTPEEDEADWIAYFDQIEVNSTPGKRFSTQPYPLSVEEETVLNRDNRYLNGVGLVVGNKTYTSAARGNKKFYTNNTTTSIFSVKAGDVVRPTFTYMGHSMSGYVYVDWGNDGMFNAAINNDGTPAKGSDVVSYSAAKIGETWYTSDGTTVADGNTIGSSMPTFTIPAGTPAGFYRMRYKVDWNSLDPAGNSASGNLIVDNGGGIIDLLLEVHNDDITVNASQLNGDIVLAANDEELQDYSAVYGQPLTVKIKPAPGFVQYGFILKYGNNLTAKEQFNDKGNPNWFEVSVPYTEIAADGTYAIPAEYLRGGQVSIMGDMQQEQLYTVEVVGVEGQGGVVYANIETTHQGTVRATQFFTAEQVTAIPVEGYDSMVAVNDRTITVTYTKPYRQVASLSELKNYKVYQIKSVNNRGSYAWNTTITDEYLSVRGAVDFPNNYPNETVKAKYSEAVNPFDKTTAWHIFKEDDSYYLYNLAKGAYVTRNGRDYKFTDTKTALDAIRDNGDGTFSFHAGGGHSESSTYFACITNNENLTAVRNWTWDSGGGLMQIIENPNIYTLEYTVEVVGAETGGIIFEDANYLNGDKVKSTPYLTAADVVAMNIPLVSAATVTVSPEEAKITVTYLATGTPVLDEDCYYTLECYSGAAHLATRYIGIKDKSTIWGQSAIPAYIQFEAAEGGYYIKVAALNKYLNSEAKEKANVTADDTKSTVWVLEKPNHGNGTYYSFRHSGSTNLYLNNNGGTNLLQANKHDGGPGETNACSLWQITEYDQYQKDRLEESVNAEIAAAQAKIDECLNYYPEVALQTTEPQDDYYVSTNAQEDKEGPIANLVDGSNDSHFHSEYSTNVGANHYININLGSNNATKLFKFKYATRRAETNFPKTIEVSGSNDGTTFTPITTVTNLPVGNANENKIYISQIIESEIAYAQLRFTVTANNSGGKEAGNHPFFHMAEFDLMPSTTPVVIDAYANHVHVPAAVAAAQDAVDAAQAAVESTSATEIEFAILVAAMQNRLNDLEAAKVSGTLPILVSVDVNKPIVYKIGIKRDGNKVLQFDYRGTPQMVAVADDNASNNKNQGWYFTKGSADSKVFIHPYLGGGDVLSAKSTANSPAAVWAAVIGAETHQEWTIPVVNSNNGTYNIKAGDNSNYFSNNGGVNNKMGFWSNDNTTDGGSLFTFSRVEYDGDVWKNCLDAYKKTFCTTTEYAVGEGLGYHQGAAAYNTARSTAETVLANATSTSEEYKNAYTALRSAMEALSFNVPAAGKFYRIKGKVSGKYMNAATDNAKMKLSDDANDAGSIFFLFEDSKLLSYKHGTYLKESHTIGAIGATNGHTISFNPSERNHAGYFTLKTSYGDSPYIYDDKNDDEVDRTSNYTENNCEWAIEEVTELPFTISSLGYGTLWAPVALEIPEQHVKAYTGVVEGDYLVLTKITEEAIPANTGVVIYRDVASTEATTHDFKIVANPESSETNSSLSGGAATIASSSATNPYTLQTHDFDEDGTKEGIAFKKFSGENITGFKAYLEFKNGEQAQALRIRFAGEQDEDDNQGGDATEVEKPTANGQHPTAIYDLQGRRVLNPTKGMYIVNGKKMVIK